MSKNIGSENSIIFFVLILFFAVPSVWATPPSQIKIEYDKENKKLHIDVKHVVPNHIPQHRIRKNVVYKNESEFETFYYPTQKPMGVAQDVDIDLKSGDTVKVVAYCTEAGPKEENLVIPEDESEEKVSPVSDKSVNEEK